MTSFTIPRITADRLSRLPLACADETGPTGHIGVRITPTAVRFAAKHATVADMFTLDSILADTRAGGDPVALNQAFHQAIYGAAHNRFLRRALDALTDSTYLLGRSTLSSADRARAALKEHTQIAEAIKAGDAERAEQAIQSHIRNALVERLKLLRRQPDAGHW